MNECMSSYLLPFWVLGVTSPSVTTPNATMLSNYDNDDDDDDDDNNDDDDDDNAGAVDADDDHDDNADD
jgi:hypothetical protein